MKPINASPLVLALALAGTGALASEERKDDASAEITPAKLVDSIEQMTEAELKAFYLRCTREAVGGRLNRGHIALCSVGYERLLKSTFQGNFVALLEWRRGLQRGEPLHSPF